MSPVTRVLTTSSARSLGFLTRPMNFLTATFIFVRKRNPQCLQKKLLLAENFSGIQYVAMSHHRLAEPRIDQVSIRLTDAECQKLDDIVDKEDRTRPYL